MLIEEDRKHLNDAMRTENMMQIRGRWRVDRHDDWTDNVLLHLTIAPFTRLFLIIPDCEPETVRPGDPTVLHNKVVIATYGLG